ncbi:hypothetical protein I6G82_08715 [Lysinibacillus macroides]|uniref:hypothetical protein n=1 Tax=Lysinibacillus macroides TaxID=33935 RepID=UPI0006B512DF|nr:hypothetical protein [Lysinibacillus macroides]QPR69645.1 hypothetical protein I6G82_08715 [Lysinibacillus macroides]
MDINRAPPLIDTFIVPEVPGVLYALFDYGLTVYFAKSDFQEAYWLTLLMNDDREIGLRLDDTKHLLVYLYEESYLKDYKLLSDFDLTAIEQLFH